MIASVTLTRNDWHCLEQWSAFYQEYASALAMHIVVDNSSRPEYRRKLKELFPHSVHLPRETNGGTTGAYNTGISWILENHPEVDAILLIANDIEISAEDVQKLYSKLMSDIALGAVAPVLLDGTKEKVVAYGELLYKDFRLNRLHCGEEFHPESLPPEQPSECLPGGICMVRTDVYRRIGLQDESLFMYFDENDFFYRTTQAGYKLVTFRDAVAAHCHIVTEGKGNNSGLAWFYINRNQLFLCRKYRGLGEFLLLWLRKSFFTGFKYSARFLFRERSLKKVYYYQLGIFCGFWGIKQNFIQK